MSSSYPLSHQISIAFSELEDRLVIRSQNTNGQMVWLLLTRRMTLVLLKQLLEQLHRISHLEQTPAQYWLETLQMDHSQAMQAKRETDEKALAYSGPLPAKSTLNPSQKPPQDPAKAATPSATSGQRQLYLASHLQLEKYPKYVLLAFKGLAMPQAMVTPSRHVPVFALRLDRDHLHQLIRLLIAKAQEAHWHLPVEIPWLKAPEAQETSLALQLLH